MTKTTTKTKQAQIAAIAIATATVILSIRLLAFVDRYTVNMLFRDQFDFLQSFFDGADLWTRFAWQHGPHRQGLGALLLTLIYDLSNWNTRVEGWVTAGIPLLFLTLFQYEQFALTQNPSHGPLPGMIVQATALAMLIPRVWVRGLIMAGLCFLGVYTGFGFFLGVLIPAFIAQDLVHHWRSRRDRIGLTVSLVLAVAGTASFFVGYKHQPAIDCYKFPHDRPVEYIAFARVLFGRAVGAMQAFAHDRVVRIGASITAYGLLWLDSSGRYCEGDQAARSSCRPSHTVPCCLPHHLRSIRSYRARLCRVS